MIRILPRFVQVLISTLLISLLADCAAFASVNKKQVTENFCISLNLSERKGREKCHAEFDISSVKVEQRVCISTAAWESYLLQSNLYLKKCGIWKGKWRPFTVPENQVSRNSEEKKKTFYTFYAESVPLVHVDELSGLQLFWFSFLKWVEKKREYLSKIISPHDPLGVLRRLLVNERSSKGPEQLMRMLGFVHLVSATGIHLYALANLVHRGSFWITSFLPIPLGFALWVSRVFTFLVWCFAWLLEGLRAGMLRPWIVVCLRGLSRVLGLRWFFYSPLLISMSVDLAIAYFWQWNRLPGEWAPGRWHYALAVGGGLMAIDLARLRDRKKNRTFYPQSFGLREHFSLSVGSWLPTAILDAWNESFVAIFTPLLSLITIPVLSTFVYPSLLFTIPFSSFENGIEEPGFLSFVFNGTHVFLETLFSLAMQFKSFWWVDTKFVGLSCFLAILTLLTTGLFSDRIRHLKVKVFILLILIVSFKGLFQNLVQYSGQKRFPIQEQAFKVEQLDVGQGDATFISFEEGRHGLIDTGSSWSFSESDWLKLFLRRGITRVDWIALTHLDGDHSGGVSRILRVLHVDCVFLGAGLSLTPRGRTLIRDLREAGVDTDLGTGRCLPFPFISIPESRSKIIRMTRAGNRVMNAFLVPIESGFYLNFGDANAKTELRLAKQFIHRFPIFFNSDGGEEKNRILKISHHGSKYSTSRELIDLIRPTEVWISSGRENPYGHPAVETVLKLKDLNVRVRRTDELGSLTN